MPNTMLAVVKPKAAPGAEIREVKVPGFGRTDVQVGEYSAFPHGSVATQVIREGTIVLMDGGCKVEGYTSDITRTFVLGKPSDKMNKVFEIVHRAQAETAASWPGMPNP